MCDTKSDIYDPVNHPSHYLKAAIAVEPIELTARLNACLGQAVNYIVRAPYKGNEREDLEKAVFYLKKYLEVTLDVAPYAPEPCTAVQVLGRLFANNSANQLTRSVLTEIFKGRYFYPDNIHGAITVIETYLSEAKEI